MLLQLQLPIEYLHAKGAFGRKHLFAHTLVFLVFFLQNTLVAVFTFLEEISMLAFLNVVLKHLRNLDHLLAILTREQIFALFVTMQII